MLAKFLLISCISLNVSVAMYAQNNAINDQNNMPYNLDINSLNEKLRGNIVINDNSGKNIQSYGVYETVFAVQIIDSYQKLLMFENVYIDVLANYVNNYSNLQDIRQDIFEQTLKNIYSHKGELDQSICIAMYYNRCVLLKNYNQNLVINYKYVVNEIYDIYFTLNTLLRVIQKKLNARHKEIADRLINNYHFSLKCALAKLKKSDDFVTIQTIVDAIQ